MNAVNKQVRGDKVRNELPETIDIANNRSIQFPNVCFPSPQLFDCVVPTKPCLWVEKHGVFSRRDVYTMSCREIGN